MQELLSFLSSVHPLPPELWKHLASILKTREVGKKEVLLDIGQVCRHIWFVESGLFRCYDLDGKKAICSWFMREGDTIASVGSFYGQRPSHERIDALEPGVVHYITYEELQAIYHGYPSFNFNGRVLTEKYYQLADDRNYMLKMPLANDRYRYFLQRNFDLARRVPDEDLASYLGMGRWTLSRIKNRAMW